VREGGNVKKKNDGENCPKVVEGEDTVISVPAAEMVRVE